MITSLTLNGVGIDGFNSFSNEYSLINGPSYFSLTQIPDRIPAIVDPLTFQAAKENQVQLKITPLSVVTLQIVGVSNNLPTMQTRFALIDQAALMKYLAAKNPELVKVNELWLTKELINTVDLSEKLAGLTIYDQETLINENFSPTNASWTVRGIQLLIVSSLVMYILLFWLVLKNIFNDDQVRGWILSGHNSWSLFKQIIIQLNLFILVGLTVALVFSQIFTPLYIETSAFDINGLIATPSLAVNPNWNLYTFLISGIFLATLTLSFGYTRLHSSRSQISK